MADAMQAATGPRLRLVAAAVLWALCWPVASVTAAKGSGAPVQKALTLLDDLKGNVVAEGKEANELYRKETELCTTRSGELTYSVKSAKKRVEELTALIAKATSKAEASGLKAQKLVTSIAESEDELQKATDLRKKEAEDFAANEKELSETADAISRASGIIEREIQKGSSFAQLSGAGNLAVALDSMVQAFSLRSADASRLASLLQTTRKANADAEDFSWSLQAPGEVPAYKSSSKGLLEALESLHRDAQQELEDARKEETESLHNFELKQQSLQDAIKFAKSDLDKAKAVLAESNQQKAVAAGDLKETQADLAEDLKSQAELKKSCIAKAEDYQAETKARAEELAALTKAQEAIKQKVAGVEAASLLAAREGQPASLLQVASSKAAKLAPGSEAVHLVRSLGFAQDSTALTQLASRMESTLRLGSKQGEDIFEKIRGMITGMVSRLEKEAREEASKKEYCDREMSQATEKQEDKGNAVNRLSSKAEQMVARVSKLKEETQQLRQELSDLSSAQAEMDRLRQEEKALYVKQKPEVKGGLEGVKLAIKVLREFYGGKGGKSSTVVALLEVAESDFSKKIAEMDIEEERAKDEYQKMTEENKVTQQTKQQDLKYKAKEAAEVDKAINEVNNDLTSAKEELDAINEYFAELQKQCVAKAEDYEVRVQKRQAEIAGLRDALKALEVGPSFLQVARRVLRGTPS